MFSRSSPATTRQGLAALASVPVGLLILGPPLLERLGL
jgi:hypothetical protein